MFGIPLEYLITYIVRMMTMAKPAPLTKAEKAELKRLRDIQNKKNRVRGASNAGVNAEAAGVATEDPVARMKRATGQTGLKKGGMAKKGYKKGGMAKKGYKKGGMMKKKGYAMGGMMKKGYAAGGKFPDLNKDGEVTQADVLQGRGVKKMSKGGMAKKGYAMGGMMKKGYAKGGPTKKKGAKKGGKVRGVGIARKGFRPVKMR